MEIKKKFRSVFNPVAHRYKQQGAMLEWFVSLLPWGQLCVALQLQLFMLLGSEFMCLFLFII